jgi:hypothetical protein
VGFEIPSLLRFSATVLSLKQHFVVYIICALEKDVMYNVHGAPAIFSAKFKNHLNQSSQLKVRFLTICSGFD